MVLSPTDSPKPAPGATKSLPAKAKALAILNATKSPATSATTAASTPTDGNMDLAEAMNDKTRKQYVTGSRLGEGTYAIVYSGHYINNPSSLVAIKKIKVNAKYKDGVAMDAYREMKFLQELNHPNIIRLHAVFSTKDQNLSLVLEHLPLGDLEQLWKNKNVSYGAGDIKAWACMIARGIWFCHKNFILHRDIKGNNLLIAADGTVKLADFGLARSFADPFRPMTYNVITRYYRPPELFYGARFYNGAVDIWSVGVVIAELTLRDFFLAGETDLHQLTVISDVFGTPTEENWPGVSKLEYYISPTAEGGEPFKRPKGMNYWRQMFGVLGDEGIDLIKGMCTLDPKKRLTATQVLEHRFWNVAPRPTEKGDLPRNSSGVGTKAMGEDLKRRGGEIESGRADKVARKLF